MAQLPPALAGGKKIIIEKALAEISVFFWLKPIKKAQFSAPAKAGGN